MNKDVREHASRIVAERVHPEEIKLDIYTIKSPITRMATEWAKDAIEDVWPLGRTSANDVDARSSYQTGLARLIEARIRELIEAERIRRRPTLLSMQDLTRSPRAGQKIRVWQPNAPGVEPDSYIYRGVHFGYTLLEPPAVRQTIYLSRDLTLDQFGWEPW